MHSAHSKLSILTHLYHSSCHWEDVPEASCLSVQGLHKCLEENKQTFASIVLRQAVTFPVLLLQHHQWRSQSPCQTEMCVWTVGIGRNKECGDRRKEKQCLAGCEEELLLERGRGLARDWRQRFWKVLERAPRKWRLACIFRTGVT